MKPGRSRAAAATIIAHVRWGRSPPFSIRRYEFQTSSQLEAFLLGVDEASGWMDYHVLEEGECVACGHREASHRTNSTCSQDGCRCRGFAAADVLERSTRDPASTSRFVEEVEDALAGLGAAAVTVVAEGDDATTLLVVRDPEERFVLTVARAGD